MLTTSRHPLLGRGTQASLALLVASIIASTIGLGPFVKLAWPLLMSIVAFYWCSRSPSRYIETLLWAVILSPGLRHYVDWRTSFSQTNPIMLAPYCVVFAASGPILVHLINGRRYAIEMLVLILSVAVGVGISLSSGEIKEPLMAAMRWLAPVWCGLYICAKAESLAGIRKSVRAVFTLAVPAVAIYGIGQFISILPWDAYFMKEAPINSIGFPEPFLVRVFATMNSPGSLAAMLCTGLLLMLPRVRILIWVIAIIGLVLTTQRAALTAFLIALVALAVGGRDRVLRWNLVKLAGSLSIAVMLVLSVPGASKKLIGSATSVTHLQDDESAQERWRQYTSASGMIDAYKAGHGLGWTTNGVFISIGDQLSIDSGLLDIFISLGIVGGSLFLFALLALLAQGWHIARSTRDPMAYGEFAAALYGIAQLPFGDEQTSEHGIFLYLSLGLLLARPLAARQKQPEEFAPVARVVRVG